MRFAVIVGTALVMLAQSSAHALMLGLNDFPEMAQRADTCVYGRVTSARELRAGEEGGDGLYKCVAELLVDHVVFGSCKENDRIEVFYGQGEVDRTVLAPAQSYVALLVKLPAPLKGYRSHSVHLSVFRLGWDQTVFIPEGLVKPPKLSEPTAVHELIEQIRYHRGPEVTIRPARPSFSWDEPIVFEATFTNRCTDTSLKLPFAPPPLTKYSFVDQYLSADGLPICSAGVARPDDDPQPVTVDLAPHMSTTRSVTVHPGFRSRAKHALASIAKMRVEYSTGCVQRAEGAWTGSALSAPATIRITDDEDTFGRKLAPVTRASDAATPTPAKRLTDRDGGDGVVVERAASSRFTWQAIASLIVGAIGVFIFVLYRRRRLRERKALASEPPQDMIA